MMIPLSVERIENKSAMDIKLRHTNKNIYKLSRKMNECLKIEYFIPFQFNEIITNIYKLSMFQIRSNNNSSSRIISFVVFMDDGNTRCQKNE